MGQAQVEKKAKIGLGNSVFEMRPFDNYLQNQCNVLLCGQETSVRPTSREAMSSECGGGQCI